MMQLLSELMSVEEVDARFERFKMDVMVINIVVWLVAVLAVAGLLIYVQRRVKRENGGWAPWRWLLPGCIVFGVGMGMRLAFDSPFARAAIAGLAAMVLAGCFMRASKMTR